MDDPRFDDLLDSLIEVGQKLSQAMGSRRRRCNQVHTITDEDAKNEAEALKVAYAVAHSPLVKTAFFASDPNLGRILAAVRELQDSGFGRNESFSLVGRCLSG